MVTGASWAPCADDSPSRTMRSPLPASTVASLVAEEEGALAPPFPGQAMPIIGQHAWVVCHQVTKKLKNGACFLFFMSFFHLHERSIVLTDGEDRIASVALMDAVAPLTTTRVVHNCPGTIIHSALWRYGDSRKRTRPPCGQKTTSIPLQMQPHPLPQHLSAGA